MTEALRKASQPNFVNPENGLHRTIGLVYRIVTVEGTVVEIAEGIPPAVPVAVAVAAPVRTPVAMTFMVPFGVPVAMPAAALQAQR